MTMLWNCKNSACPACLASQIFTHDDLMCSSSLILRDCWISTNDENGSVDFGVAIPQTTTYATTTKVPAPAVELSNCFCGHCSAISIERFRRKVSFSGIAGVSEWMARRRRLPFSAHRRPVSNHGVYRTATSILPVSPFIQAAPRKS